MVAELQEKLEPPDIPELPEDLDVAVEQETAAASIQHAQVRLEGRTFWPASEPPFRPLSAKEKMGSMPVDFLPHFEGVVRGALGGSGRVG